MTRQARSHREVERVVVDVVASEVANTRAARLGLELADDLQIKYI